MFVCGYHTPKGWQYVKVNKGSRVSDLFSSFGKVHLDDAFLKAPEIRLKERTQMFQKGDVVRVKYNGGCYSTYDDLFLMYPNLLKKSSYIRHFKEGDKFTVIDVVPHTVETGTNIVVMKDNKGDVALCTEDLDYLERA